MHFADTSKSESHILKLRVQTHISKTPPHIRHHAGGLGIQTRGVLFPETSRERTETHHLNPTLYKKPMKPKVWKQSVENVLPCARLPPEPQSS